MRTQAFVFFVACVAAVPAQERLRVQGPTPATVVLGSSARVDLVVEGRGANPEQPPVPKVDGLQIRVAGPSRQSFTSITPQGMVEQNTTTWQIVLTPQREGAFTVPAFSLQTGTRQQTVPAMQVTAVKELRGAEYGFLSVRFEKQRVYVHEPIRALVEFGVDKGLRPVQDVAQDRTRYVDFEVQAPWLSQMEGAEALADEEPGGDNAPVVLNRTLQPSKYDSAHQRAGKAYNRFSFQKSFLPTRPGKLTLDAPMLRYHVQLTEGRQNLFGERVGGQSQNFYVYGEPIALEVLPIPEAGRPQPYFGAVGRFQLSASLDRDTVKVGSSVKLKLSIAGSGNFEFLRLPEVSSWEQKGLHLLGQTEDRKADGISVVYDLTPMSDDVKEIPPVAWNWFDTTPGVEKFVESKTQAMPLAVQALAAGEALAALPEATKKTVTPGVDDIFDLKERGGEPRRVVDAPRVVLWAAAFGPWIALACALAFRALRRRAQADPGRARSNAAMRSFSRALDAGAEPADALVGYLADRMDVNKASLIGGDLAQVLERHGAPQDLALQCAGAVERGVASRYGGGASLSKDEAQKIVAALERGGLRRRDVAGPAPRALFALVALCASANAQSDAGYAAWQKGDYAAARVAFEKAIEQEDDRRLFYALGNCCYRLGDLPRALWAYECARLGMPRDAELLANISLVRKRLELETGGEPFANALAELRDRLSVRELAALCLVLMSASAGLFAWSRRRTALRWLCVALLVPGSVVALELLWLRPSRPPRAIALEKASLTAEPRAGMDAVATVAAGAEVSVRSGTAGEFVRVEAEGRGGYAPSARIAVIR